MALDSSLKVFFLVKNYASARQSVAALILCPYLHFFRKKRDSSFPEVNFTHSEKGQMVDFVPKFRRGEGMCAHFFVLR